MGKRLVFHGLATLSGCVLVIVFSVLIAILLAMMGARAIGPYELLFILPISLVLAGLIIAEFFYRRRSRRRASQSLID